MNQGFEAPTSMPKSNQPLQQRDLTETCRSDGAQSQSACKGWLYPALLRINAIRAVLTKGIGSALSKQRDKNHAKNPSVIKKKEVKLKVTFNLVLLAPCLDAKYRDVDGQNKTVHCMFVQKLLLSSVVETKNNSIQMNNKELPLYVYPVSPSRL